jgi:hypothetical protein
MAAYLEQNDMPQEEYPLDQDLLHPGLDTFTLYDSESLTLAQLLGKMLGNVPGIQIDNASLNYIGVERAISYFDSLSLAPGIGLNNSGLLLTSGDGAPALSNNHPSYTVDNSNSVWVEYDAPQWEAYEYEDDNGDIITEGMWEEGYWELIDNGDDQLTQIAQTAFEGAGDTQDATVLEFSFTITDSSIRSISLDLMFGSEEYPDFTDTDFVDIAAVIVNDRNYAYIDGDETKPLSIVGATTEDGRFIDNNITENSPLDIEYNGITPKLTISIPLEENQDVYNVRIGIADTGDTAYDSGLFVSNLQALTSSYEGTLVNVEASNEGSILTAAAPDTATKFVGGKGNDTMKGSTAPDVYDLQSGGENTIQGKLANLNQDTVVGFSEKDTLSIDQSFFTPDQLKVTMGSAILDIELDDSEPGSVKLEGDFRKGVFVTSRNDTGTDIRFQALDLEPDSIYIVSTEGDTITIETGGLVKLLGNTAGKSIIVKEGSSVMNVSAGTDVTLKGIERKDIQFLRDGTTLQVVDKQGNTLAQMAASTTSDIDQASTLTLGEDTLWLAAEAEMALMGLINIQQDEDLSNGIIFSGDGDRLMGSDWPQQGMIGLETPVAELTGVHTPDLELLV